MTTPIRLCPKCGGAGRAGAAVVTDYPPLWIPCEMCKGTSVVEDDDFTVGVEMLRAVVEGEKGE